MVKSKLRVFLLISVFLLVVSIVFVGGCTSQSSTVEPSPITPPLTPVNPVVYSSISIPIEEFPNHQHIDAVMHAVVGGELTVTLGSNPTTGFKWSESAQINDESVVKQVSHEFVGPGIDKPPGTSGEEVWTFKALKEGATIIYLEYSRDWEEDDIGHWTVTITANVN